MPKAGLLRIALAGAIALLLSEGWAVPEVVGAYLATAFAAVFGVLLAVGWPRTLLRARLVHVVLDSLSVAVLIGDTGGGNSPFFPLCILAALGIVWITDRTKVLAGAAALIGGYLAAVVVSAEEPGALLAPVVGLRAGFVALSCVVVGFVGDELRKAREDTQSLSSALAEEREHGEKVAALVSRFSPVLEISDPEGVLDWMAKTARDSLGVPYAHAALLDGPRHRTATAGESDASPSWWHPTIQRLTLWSSRADEVLRSEETLHGIEGFVAVPIISPSGEGLGALIAGGKKFGVQEERTLKLIAGGAASALERAGDAPGGRDPISKLPNHASLRHVLKRELAQDIALTVLVADLDRFRRYNRLYGLAAGDNLLRKIGEKLGEGRQRVFRHGEDEFVFILRGSNRTRARKLALSAQQTVEKLTANSAVPLTASVGFAVAGPEDREPDPVLNAAFGALARAKSRPERVFGVSVDEGLRAIEDLEGDARVAGAILALVEAAEIRDPGAGEHLRAVSRIARRLGSKMALAHSQMGALVVGALLHDIGKIGIPDHVLRKPGHLSGEEYELMKQHPILGARILESVEGLSPALPVVRHHHERFDGNGYPDGLRGEEIPLIVRIAFVADAFDTMTRDRPYSPGTSEEAALEEIMRNSGIHFDPQVVRALEELLKESGGLQAGFAE